MKMNPRIKLMREKDLADNPSDRLPICLCVDTSSSMNTVVRGETRDTGRTVQVEGRTLHVVEGGESRISDVNTGLREFYRSIMDDDMAIDIVELSVVSFDDEARCALDFIGMEKQTGLADIVLKAQGEKTQIGQGVQLALQVLDERVREYQEAGVRYYRPWLVIMTDGEATRENSNVVLNNEAAGETRKREQDKRLVVFPVCTEDTTGESLEAFSKHKPLKFDQTQFREFFRCLTDSAKIIATDSTPGAEGVDLDKVYEEMAKKTRR